MPKCNILHNHANLDITGYWRPCCVFNSKYSNLKTNNFKEYRSSSDFKKIIEDMEENNIWHPGCQKCKDDETIGKTGFRRQYNEKLSGIPNRLEFIELSVSNKCNLSCKMCGPWASSKWQEIVNNNEEIKKWHKPIKNINHTIKEIFNEVDISNLNKIKYLGGETFITKEIGELFNYLDSQKLVENIEFECSTNCTVFPKKYIDVLNRFQHITIYLSIDGIGPLANYIRTGISWDRILPVIIQWSEYFKFRKENFKSSEISINTVVQAYNIHQIADIIKFGKNLGFHSNGYIIEKPEYLSLNSLPDDYKLKIINNLENNKVPEYIIKSLKKSKYNPELFKKLKEYTMVTDNIMKTSIDEVIPELFLLFDNI